MAGQTRYETSLQLANCLTDRSSNTAIIATGGNYADALSISPYAFATKSPVLLCDAKTGLGNDAITYLKENNFTHVVLVGGVNAVPASVEKQVNEAGTQSVLRLFGATRYETSAEIVDFEIQTIGLNVNGLFLATGQNFPDALAAGPVAGSLSTPLLLADPGADIAKATLTKYANEVSKAYLVGGTAAISSNDAATLASALSLKIC